ncbi:MAG: saccharopine dehydrogenase NADP-binding domain-containing protein [Flavisolibacter sp.]|nr:saccharopine dehydrogenase NADP-binding domain-containing protein [Flavisolibacter sp.]
MQQNTFLLYGANGYTGQLIARYAADYHLQPTLAGRREEALIPLAQQLNLPYKVLDLANAVALQAVLKEHPVVVHAAGPFQFTAKQMADACLQTGTRYLDINGDISVFELLKGYDEKAKAAGIMILPGAGFDVVPTDCTALLLKKALPDAISLKLAFATLGGAVSHGTAQSMLIRLGEKGAVRKNGQIVRVPLGQKGMWVDFGVKKLFVMTIPWGDVATAYYTTGIPDIEAYTGISPTIYRLLKVQGLFNWALRTPFIRKLIKKRLDKQPAGPSDDMRAKAMSLVWGQVTNAAGKRATARLSSPDGYTLTAYSSLLMVQKVLQGKFTTGYQTPATAYGEDFVLEIPGVKREPVQIE